MTLLERWTRLAAKRPWHVLVGGVVFLALVWGIASRLEVRSDFVDLLPTDSPAARRFHATLARKGGAASTLIVVVEAPSAEIGRALVDRIEHDVRRLPATLVGTVEHGPAETRAFFDRWRWLFAEEDDLQRIDCELSRERARHVLGFVELDDPCSDAPPPEHAGAPTGESALHAFQRRIDARVASLDRFPTGYFRDESGRHHLLLIHAPSTGLDRGGETLLTRVKEIAERARTSSLRSNSQPSNPANDPTRGGVQIGLAGDIPNALAERDALVENMTTVSVIAVLLVLLSIVIYFRSPLALVHVGIAVFAGTGVAFAVAALAYGHLNAATSFLGSIVFGNGINHGIVHFDRFRERRARGDSVEDALVDAALVCRRGTWLAALAGSGAYAALLLTSFRGFSEFGLIGGVGMVACWLATFVLGPASIAAAERFRHRAPPPVFAERPVARRAAWLVSKLAWPIVVGTLALGVWAALLLPKYFADPWEYDFAKLRSESTALRGAGRWSSVVDGIFQVRGSPQLLLADDLEHALPVADAVRASDRRVTGGHYVSYVETVWNRLGGPPDVVARKLDRLAAIRESVDAILPHLEGEDAEIAARWRPPDDLRALRPDDLPVLVRDQFTENDGRVGTPVYVTLASDVSQSDGHNLLRISRILEGVHLPDGSIVPNASRAAIFAEMIRAMERDGPRATLLAFVLVMLLALVVTRRIGPALAVILSLVVAVLFTVAAAARLDERLNFLNFIALPLTFGIGVEYAINLYERVRAEGGDPIAGLRSGGGAVLLCSVTTMLGYGALLFADNRALASLGRYALGGELACISTALVLLPAVLHLMRATPPGPLSHGERGTTPDDSEGRS